MKAQYNRHKPECDKHTCYCLDDGQGDPMCDCGNPAWCCRCGEYLLKRDEVEKNDEWDWADQFAWDFEKHYGPLGAKLRSALAAEVLKTFKSFDPSSIETIRDALIKARDCIVFDGSLGKEEDTRIANETIAVIDNALKLTRNEGD